MLTAINPATGDVVGKFEEITNHDAGQRLERAQQAFEDWRATR
ncbi:MAG: aldehyde dehydrogenase family protein [Desulfobacterales bacterium]